MNHLVIINLHQFLLSHQYIDYKNNLEFGIFLVLEEICFYQNVYELDQYDDSQNSSMVKNDQSFI